MKHISIKALIGWRQSILLKCETTFTLNFDLYLNLFLLLHCGNFLLELFETSAVRIAIMFIPTHLTIDLTLQQMFQLSNGIFQRKANTDVTLEDSF